MTQILYILVERYEGDDIWNKNVVSSLNQEKIIQRKIREEAINTDEFRSYFIDEVYLI